MSKLPSATKDVNQALRDLDEHGYAILADVLTNRQVETMKERFVEQMIAEAQLHDKTVSLDDPDLRCHVGALLNKGKIWQDLIDPTSLEHQVLDAALRPAVSHKQAKKYNLEQAAICGSMDGLFKRREGSVEHAPEGQKYAQYGLMFHIDQNFVPGHLDYPVAVNSFHTLTDFTYDNGATLVVPGTHKQAEINFDGYKGDDAIPIEVPAGSNFMLDGRLWHAAGINTSGELRASVNKYYAAPWIRQRWPMAMNLRQDVVDQLSEAQLKLLGFDTMWQCEYGAFTGPNIIEPQFGRANVSSKQRIIGELHLA